MPKRRRGHSKSKAEVKEEKLEASTSETPGTPEPEVDEDEEAAAAVQELLASPVSAPPAQPVLMLTPTTAQLQVARTRLSGLLHRVSKPTGTPAADDSDSSQDDVPLSQTLGRTISPLDTSAKHGSPAPTPMTKVKTEAGTASSSSKHSTKRRRRREAVADSAFHHTYVMKLFDRSVDLAQFSETTSLYPVCRAWMANQPRNPNLLPKRRSPSPTPSEEEDEDKSDNDSAKDSNDEDVIKSVYKLPPPNSLVDLDQPLRVPSPRPHVVEPIIINQEAEDGGRDEQSLLSEHLANWRAVKTKWMHAGHLNERRYSESISIIEEIYKKAQEMYS